MSARRATVQEQAGVEAAQGRRSWSRRPARLAVALAALAALVTGFVAPIASDVATAPPAAANCPPGSPGGGLVIWWGQEWNVGGTCDWDNTYHGWLQDSVTDGSCVYSEFVDAGWWNVQGYACDTGAWIDYWKWDNNGDFYSQMIICRDWDCFPGWVDNYGY
jgi:hypothetical protein